MAIAGRLSTMPLPELLQWLGSASKTGTLQIERDKVVKRIVFRDGKVIASASNEPKERLGQYLLSRGKVSEDKLREALTRQEETGEHLGQVLVDDGAISRDELTRCLSAQAEETIFGLFLWDEAVFRFHEGRTDGNPFTVDLAVDDILLRGMQRLDETRRIRTVFNDPGIVLTRTDKDPPAEISHNRMALGIFGFINGERTVAEIVLHAHTSEYYVTRFLFELFRGGYVEIREVRSVPGDSGLHTSPGDGDEIAAGGPRLPEQESAAGPGATLPHERASAAAVAESPPSRATTLHDDLQVARRLIAQGELTTALEVLEAAYRDCPEDESLGRLLEDTEAAFVDEACRGRLQRERIPFLSVPPESLGDEALTPEDFYLISRIDGTLDIKSIVQICPLREYDVLRTLEDMLDRGLIELRDPV